MHDPRSLPFVAVGALALLAACATPAPSGDLAGEGAMPLDAATQAARYRTPGNVPAHSGVPSGVVTIRFAAAVGDAAFQCGSSYGGIGITGSTVLPADFRFFVSDVALIDEAGRALPLALAQDGRWQYRNVALLDFEDGSGPCAGGTIEMRQIVVGELPPGRYRGLAFTLGVPPDLNVGSPGLAAAPLNDPALAWPAPGGFRFLKIDMATTGQPLGPYAPPLVGLRPAPLPYPATAPALVAGPGVPAYPAGPYGFPVHIGGAACTGYTPSPYYPPAPGCAFPTRLRVTFPDFDPSRDVVVADLRGLLVSTNVDANMPGTPAGCQSTPGDPDCAGIAAQLAIAYPGTGAPVQSFFRRVPSP
ncbi:MAG: metallo-mystery pair system four-Cys motif protein [Alphaproteobacteria bacterium]|nr:metallo-mystery pair system four-Cys motif protein [Alphaproteobacteria bacterium]